MSRRKSVEEVASSGPSLVLLSGCQSGNGKKSVTLILGALLLEPENPCAILIRIAVSRAVEMESLLACSCSRELMLSNAFLITVTGVRRKTSLLKSSPNGDVRNLKYSSSQSVDGVFKCCSH